MYTKREALILDGFFEDYLKIRPPLMPCKKEDFDDFFVQKYSREVLFEYIDENSEGTNLVDCITKFISSIVITKSQIHKESILCRCLSEEYKFAKEVLKALTER